MCRHLTPKHFEAHAYLLVLLYYYYNDDDDYYD